MTELANATIRANEEQIDLNNQAISLMIAGHKTHSNHRDDTADSIRRLRRGNGSLQEANVILRGA